MDENVIEWLTGDENACVTFSQKKYKNRIKRLKEQNEALHMIENEDGSVYAVIPLSWIKISKPRTVELTDEEREELAERMRKLNKKEEQNDVDSEQEID